VLDALEHDRNDTCPDSVRGDAKKPGSVPGFRWVLRGVIGSGLAN
jgi:hypothetical protein